ncbi:hypothetical protein BGX38DRAFT_1333860 [Terfezia claveryi]|nr:hypothetical protein BGX38DRAFT_1334053 [Terfezia claveryi]KAF8433123.1 hypothetical protein BGX38DRAFT_1333860 [Terfezia claveryi]
MRRKRMEVTMSREITLLKKRPCNMLQLRLERRSCKKISIMPLFIRKYLVLKLVSHIRQ